MTLSYNSEPVMYCNHWPYPLIVHGNMWSQIIVTADLTVYTMYQLRAITSMTSTWHIDVLALLRLVAHLNGQVGWVSLHLLHIFYIGHSSHFLHFNLIWSCLLAYIGWGMPSLVSVCPYTYVQFWTEPEILQLWHLNTHTCTVFTFTIHHDSETLGIALLAHTYLN